MTDPRPLRVGDLIRDNDPRMPGRVLRVRRIKEDVAFLSNMANEGIETTRIRLDRIHTDGRPRRSGWSLVP